MKKLILFFSCTGVSLSMLGQMTQANEPTVGQNSTMFTCETTTDPQANLTGSGITWNFSNLVGLNGQTKVIECIDPSTTPAASYYTSSTKAFNIQGSLTNYFNSTAANRVSQGFVFEEPSFGTVLAVFNTNEQTTVQYPFAFGNSLTDNFSGSLSFDFNGQAQNPTCTGNSYAQIDGSGTLQLPQGTTLNNVIRYKVTDTVFTQVIFIVPIDIELVRTQYEYYDLANSNLPVFIHTNVKLQQAGGGAPLADQTVVLSSIEPTNFASLEDMNAVEVGVYPNPTSDFIYFSNLTGQDQVELVDAMGNKLIVSNGMNSIDVHEIASGSYFLRITRPDQTMIKPIIIK